MRELIERSKQLMEEGKIGRVLGWKAGDLAYDVEPAYFSEIDELDNLIYDSFCGANLSKFLIRNTEPTLVFLKPCDTYSFNQLLKENQIERENVYIIGIGCYGKLDFEIIKAKGIKGILGTSQNGSDLVIETLYGEKTIAYSEALLERCRTCKGKTHMIYDELMLDSADTTVKGRFEDVVEIEKLPSEERFEFFQKALKSCIRCNACRNVCPACNCRKCVFDSNKFDSEQKANTVSFEEKMFHLIRGFHIAGRCTDCGECSRVCPQNIPLHLLNRKQIKDFHGLYGEFEAGSDAESKGPLTEFTLDDTEANQVRGGNFSV